MPPLTAPQLHALISCDDADAISQASLDDLAPSVLSGALLVALQARKQGALAALLQRAPHSAAPPVAGSSASWMAAATGDSPALALLIQASPASASAICDGTSPLQIAAMQGHADCVRVLLAQAAPGSSACTAALMGHTSVLEVMGQVAPASLSARDADGRTPAYLAASRGHVAALEAIAQAAPGSLALAVGGVTPVELAFNEGHEDCVRLLLRHGQPNPSSKWACGCGEGEVCAPAPSKPKGC